MWLGCVATITFECNFGFDCGFYLCLNFEIGSPVLGVGFTGSLATSRPKLGDHRYVDM